MCSCLQGCRENHAILEGKSLHSPIEVPVLSTSPNMAKSLKPSQSVEEIRGHTMPNGRDQPPVFTDHPALGAAGAGIWQWDGLARRTVAARLSAGRRHTGGSAADPSSQTLYHSAGR